MNQKEKAENLLSLHKREKLLVLPNIWDVSGAKLLQSIGFDAVATASASVAFANGFDDGENIGFKEHIEILKRIASAVDIPVTADFERGYVDETGDLAGNIKELIEAGIVGINIEDSMLEGGDLLEIGENCRRIETIRETAERSGVPFVINARTDVFLAGQFEGNRTAEAIRRAASYETAGADCFYPIGCGMDELKDLLQNVRLPINVFASNNALPLAELEKLGVSRVSNRPGVV